MKPTPIAATTLAALSLLAACGPKGGGNVAAGAPGAPASGPDVAISAADMPRPRAGLWQTTTTNDQGDKPDVTTTCYSGRAPNMPKTPQGCSQFSIKRTFLGHIVMDMNCTRPEATVVMHSEATGDFQNTMTYDSTLTMSSKEMGAKSMKSHGEAHYVGPCAPGQKPDDLPDDSNAAG